MLSKHPQDGAENFPTSETYSIDSKGPRLKLSRSDLIKVKLRWKSDEKLPKDETVSDISWYFSRALD